jgi:quercetin dioxygenase-like cupin family protein
MTDHKCCHNEKAKTVVGQAMELKALVDYAAGGIVSRTLVDQAGGSVTVFSFDAGQRLSEHQAPFDAMVNILDGTAHITIAGTPHIVKAGQMIIMPANVPHAVAAPEPFKMMLTMIKK